MSFRRGGSHAAQYAFLECRACNKEFSKILTISEHEKGGVVCPHCKSKDVEQRWAQPVYAVTSKEELIRLSLRDRHQALEETPGKEKISRAGYPARAFLSGMSRA